MKEINALKAYDIIMNALEEQYTEDLVALWNTYCEECNFPDDYIHENSEYIINDLFADNPWQLLTCLNDYSTNDDYVVFDGYGNLNSLNDITDSQSPFDYDALADWLVDNSQYWEALDIDEDACMEETDE